MFYCAALLGAAGSVCILRARSGHQNRHDHFGVHNKRKGIIQRDFQFHAVAFGLHRVPCDLLPVFWPWYDGRFHLWDGRRGFSLKLSTCDGLWRNQLFGRTFSNIYIPKGHEAKKAFEEVQQPD